MPRKLTRRRFLKRSAAALAAVAAGPAIAASTTTRGRPRRLNLLVIMTDQQRADSIRELGNVQAVTPALDSLVRSGVSFTRCYAGSPLCSPSRATIQTGRFPHATGVLANDAALPVSQTTLAEVLTDAGYSCGYVGKWHLGEGSQHEHGYRTYVEPFTGNYRQWLKKQHPPARWGKDIRWTGPHVGHSRLPVSLDRSQYLTTRAIEFLTGGAKEPFALFHSIYPPHFPICPPADWPRTFHATDMSLPPNHADRLDNKPESQRRDRYYLGNKPDLALTPDQWRDVIAHYYEMVRYADFQIGRLLEALRRTGLAERTLIVFTSDHGDMLGSHQMLWKGPYAYEEVTRVPLVLAGPSGFAPLAPGRRIDRLVSHVDLAPTLLDLLDLPAPEASQGRSMVGSLAGDAPWRDEVFSEYYDMDSKDLPEGADAAALVRSRRRSIFKMIRRDRWKFVWRPFDRDELYDLDRDPGELTNLAVRPEHSGAVTQLRQRIMAWMRQTGDPLVDLLT